MISQQIFKAKVFSCGLPNLHRYHKTKASYCRKGDHTAVSMSPFCIGAGVPSAFFIS